MLCVSLTVSIWYVCLALIPVAVLLLAVSTVLPHSGKMHDSFQAVTRSILFCPVPGVPALSFIKLVLGGLGLMAAFLSFQVYSDGRRTPLPPNADIATQLKFQAKSWRDQRNFYLTCLALSLWFMVFTVFSLKSQIAKLLAERDAARLANRSAGTVAAMPSGAAGKNVSAASSAAPVHAVAQPRRMPQPSAPEADSTNAKHLD